MIMKVLDNMLVWWLYYTEQQQNYSKMKILYIYTTSQA